MRDLGKRLKLERVRKGLTQKNVAELVDVESPTISGYETGNTMPPLDMLLKLSNIYGVSTDFLLGKEAVKTISLDGLSDSQIMAIESVLAAFREDHHTDSH